MLLRYVVLFLSSILVTAWKLTPGWVARDENSGPELRGVYWIAPRRLGISSKTGNRFPCVVLYKLNRGNLYRMARMDTIPKRVGPPLRPVLPVLPAGPFFEGNAMLRMRTTDAPLTKYRIFPYENHVIKGDPSIMKLYDGRLLIMPPQHHRRLVVASGLVDGWDPTHQDGPLLHCVYWVHAHVLGINDEPELYIPVVVLYQVENEHQFVKEYRVVRMSKIGGTNDRRATDFFADNTRLGLPRIIDELNYLRNYYIYPNEYRLVEGRPDVMQTWQRHLVKLSKSGAARLDDACKLDDAEDAAFLEYGNNFMKNGHNKHK